MAKRRSWLPMFGKDKEPSGFKKEILKKTEEQPAQPSMYDNARNIGEWSDRVIAAMARRMADSVDASFIRTLEAEAARTAHSGGTNAAPGAHESGGYVRDTRPISPPLPQRDGLVSIYGTLLNVGADFGREDITVGLHTAPPAEARYVAPSHFCEKHGTDTTAVTLSFGGGNRHYCARCIAELLFRLGVAEIRQDTQTGRINVPTPELQSLPPTKRRINTKKRGKTNERL